MLRPILVHQTCLKSQRNKLDRSHGEGINPAPYGSRVLILPWSGATPGKCTVPMLMAWKDQTNEGSSSSCPQGIWRANEQKGFHIFSFVNHEMIRFLEQTITVHSHVHLQPTTHIKSKEGTVHSQLQQGIDLCTYVQSYPFNNGRKEETT